tara:strand:+ start:826 stop:1752 length:927 start_codon:yes stop_codon:yes gene_type:complete
MKTEFNSTQGLFSSSKGQSFSLSHQKPSLRAKGSIANAGAFANDESFTLTDALGRSLTFKIDDADNTADGTLDADGNVIFGIDGAGAGAAQIARLVSLINATSLNILAVAETTTCVLYQETNGARGNTTIQTFDAAGDAAALTGATTANFSGGKDSGSAETATGIHYYQEEVTIDQTTLGTPANKLGAGEVAAQLSRKLPENSVILRASMTHSFVDSTVDNDSGDYELYISDTTAVAGDALSGNAVEIAAEILTSDSTVGTTTASAIQAVNDEQFLQIASSAVNNAEDGVIRMLVTIMYAGMGEPIEI